MTDEERRRLHDTVSGAPLTELVRWEKEGEADILSHPSDRYWREKREFITMEILRRAYRYCDHLEKTTEWSHT